VSQQELERIGAVLHGHFLLTSGRHSDLYFEKFRLLEQPALLEQAGGRDAGEPAA
jgi:orotate phosphoribosyltransferase